MTAHSIKKGICDALSNVDVTGSFSCFGVLDSCSNPALSIQGLGTIGLPLSDRDAQAIMHSSATQQSPFGKGSETLVDTNVRKSWQIDPKNFQLRNPHFHYQIDRVVTGAVAKELGVACGPENVTAQLYKLLLYEEGAFFLPHQDGEKAKGMFGTLMVCLPSEHTGGEVHLSHEGRHKTVKTSETSGFDYSYAAWYADVTHEVKPITSGTRLVLIYNLIQTGSGPTPTASASTDSESRLKQVLARWTSTCTIQHPDVPRMLAYKLSYKYSQTSLSSDSLKGSDQVKFRHLSGACSAENVVLYLARIKKEVEGGCEENDYGDGWGRHGRYGYDESDEDEEDGEDQDRTSRTTRIHDDSLGGCHKIIDICDSSIALTEVIDQNRVTVAENVDFEVGDIAQGDIFQRAPDKEDYSGYTGNEGVSATHFYHDAVALLVPKKWRVEFDYKAAKHDEQRILDWFQSLQNDFDSSSDESARLELERLCELVMEQNRTARSSVFGTYRRFSTDHHSSEVLTAVAIAALKLDDVLLLEELAPTFSVEPPLEIFAFIREAIPKLGFSTLKPALKSFLERMRQIHSKWAALLRVVGEPAPQSGHQLVSISKQIEHWIRAQIDTILAPYQIVSAKDGVALVAIADRFGKDVLEQRIAPYVEERAARTSFVIAFLDRLFEIRGEYPIPATTIQSVYSKVVSAMITYFDPGMTQQRVSGAAKWSANNGFRESVPTNKQSEMPTGAELVRILQQCETLSLKDQVNSFFGKMLEFALRGHGDVFERTLLPFLTLLIAHLQEKQSLSILGDDCSRHFHVILQAYIIRGVGPEPRRPVDFRPPTNSIHCNCKDCLDLKAFVADNGESVREFRMLATRRKHLENQIRSNDLTYHTIKSGSPHVLVIKKVHGEYLVKHEQWQHQLQCTKRALQALDRNPWLKRLLGENHDEIVNLKITDRSMTKLMVSVTRNQPLATNPSTGNKRKEHDAMDVSLAGQSKRPKPEIVDLVSD